MNTKVDRTATCGLKAETFLMDFVANERRKVPKWLV